ncbi:DUF2397 domain-containing protein [Streptomyces angustmyceticus]|uniref:DUF2397 domain-containing protein n=1 Tax=Streptomyces angustmyceticus TaxID=285578 RepID=UPI0021AF62FF|nr:DUF2397 domain-containing protein [Streptomyces angustmyceticus]
MSHFAGSGDAGDDDWIVEGWARAKLRAQDPSRVFGYVVSTVREEYAAIMDVLDQAVDHLTPAQISVQLAAGGIDLHPVVVAQRLRALRDTFLAVSGQPDNDIERWQELNGARWRYTATAQGRQVQRLWTLLAAEGMVQREIPLDGLARIREALAALQEEAVAPQDLVKLAGQAFVEHDQLDASLVGQADMLAQLADRFDLDADGTAELKQLIVEYATHVVVHLDREVVAVHAQLVRLRPRFAELAAVCRAQSRAGALVARGVLAPSRGAQEGDWEQLLSWFAPASGRAARFWLQLVRAIPMMHANLRRQQSVAGPGTLRARALSLAAACRDARWGEAVFRASLADRPWVKLHTCAEGEGGEVVSWHAGPRVPALAMLRASGQSGPRGTVAPRRDRAEAAREVARDRERVEAEQRAAVAEVLAGVFPLSDRACRVALRAVMAAARGVQVGGVRAGRVGGVGCVLTAVEGALGRVDGVGWSVLVPGRQVAFHPEAATGAACAVQRRGGRPDVAAVRVDVLA